ncbi:MAG: heavy metal translocating P-type ATPase metal-binding domain-containing protein [Bacteroidota bacterium]
MIEANKKVINSACFHCGELCLDKDIVVNKKHFCCEGCKTVFEILDTNQLCDYYSLSNNPGVSQKVKVRQDKFAYLDNEQIAEKLINFKEQNSYHVLFNLPTIHCSSCIWLLENLTRLNSNIQYSHVSFPTKEIKIIFDSSKVSLRQVAELLTSIGYEPYISLNELDGKKDKPKFNKTKIYKLGIAGFCFGNIMLMSFPEYFSIDASNVKQFELVFRYLNLILSLPVFFYSASEFYSSAWQGIKAKFLNIDAPIVLAIWVTFGRSVYEILSGTGAGYLDSMSGIVFFMLIGRVFQDRTYNYLSFERDYKSYLPVAVTIKTENGEKAIPLADLKVGDRILIHHQELVPADAILVSKQAMVDYSFVTGESIPVRKNGGEIVYAGGKQTAERIELQVIKDYSQSYLTKLWNNEIFNNTNDGTPSFIHTLSKYFTIILFSIAAISSLYWLYNDVSKLLPALTAVLIVACPCSLLLSATFTNGNILRVFGNNEFFLKKSDVIEKISKVDTVVFDKTGTLTDSAEMDVIYDGEILSENEWRTIKTITASSSHPLSKAISSYLQKYETIELNSFNEITGRGLLAEYSGNNYKLGSAIWFDKVTSSKSPEVFIEINNKFKGRFQFKNHYRKGVDAMILKLSKKYNLYVLSGDNESERYNLSQMFGNSVQLNFNQTPQDKLDFIHTLQQNGKNVMMVGDGLNDAGALKQANCGVVLTDNTNNFSPACDGILSSSKIKKLYEFILLGKAAKKIIIGSFILSILYNFVGLSFAVQGNLSPVIAAILMPVSSISIVLFTTGLSSFYGWYYQFKN